MARGPTPFTELHAPFCSTTPKGRNLRIVSVSCSISGDADISARDSDSSTPDSGP